MRDRKPRLVTVESSAMSKTAFRTLPELLTLFETAQTVEHVFGRFTTEADLRRSYRDLANATHPDHHPYFTDVAVEAFKLLQQWYERAKQQLRPIVLTSRRYRYQTMGEPQQGDLADLYAGSAETIHGNAAYPNVILKIGRQPRNNDLLAAEARVLKKINRELDGMPLRAHFPTLIETFAMVDQGGVQRQVNVLVKEPDTVSLADVIEAYPGGIDSADMAWMFNRLLVALSETHALGFVHGAIVPEHLLIRPSDHNGILIDWCYSVEIGQRVKAISPRHRAATAPEILAKQAATPAADIYMAAMTILQLLGGDVATQSLPHDVPRPIQAFLRACLIQSPHRRPNSAWELFEEFGEILFKLYGPPTFRPFSMLVD